MNFLPLIALVVDTIASIYLVALADQQKLKGASYLFAVNVGFCLHMISTHFIYV